MSTTCLFFYHWFSVGKECCKAISLVKPSSDASVVKEKTRATFQLHHELINKEPISTVFGVFPPQSWLGKILSHLNFHFDKYMVESSLMDEHTLSKKMARSGYNSSTVSSGTHANFDQLAKQYNATVAVL